MHTDYIYIYIRIIYRDLSLSTRHDATRQQQPNDTPVMMMITRYHLPSIRSFVRSFSPCPCPPRSCSSPRREAKTVTEDPEKEREGRLVGRGSYSRRAPRFLAPRHGCNRARTRTADVVRGGVFLCSHGEVTSRSRSRALAFASAPRKRTALNDTPLDDDAPKSVRLSVSTLARVVGDGRRQRRR